MLFAEEALEGAICVVSIAFEAGMGVDFRRRRGEAIKTIYFEMAPKESSS